MYIDVGNPVERTPSAYAFPLLIKQLWLAPLANAPDQEIVYRDLKRFTYREIYGRIGRLASTFAALGIKPGMTVAVLDWDSHRYFECYFAVPMIGCVLETINIRLAPETVAYTLNHAQADLILVNAEFLPLLDRIRDRLEKPVRCVLLSDDPAAAASVAGDSRFVGEYETLLAHADPDYEFPDFDENTRATTFYTTGTTGLPKGVYFSHRQLVLHTMACIGSVASAPAQGRLDCEDVYMPITPMFHVHAWGLPYVATVLGMKQVYPGRYEAPMLLRLIREEGVTFSHCVPTLLQMLLGHPDAAATDLSHMKMVIGGAAFPQGLCRRALERGMDVYSGYGMSETAPLVTNSHLSSREMGGNLDAQVRLRVLTGTPVMLTELRVVSEDMRDVSHDGQAQGEIVLRSPWLTQGYLKDPERSEELWRGGYLHTGDIAVMAADGRVQITDRLKDVIKSGGEWVSSLLIESVISKIPGVVEVAVIAIPDVKWTERPMALVVRERGADSLTAERIRASVRDLAAQGVVPEYAVPDRVRFVDALAKTSVGKLDKKALREKYAA